MTVSFSDKVYLHSPVFLQHALASLYGLRLRRERYGGNFKSYLAGLLESQWYDEEALHRLQAERLRGLIEHAAANVPYYQELLRKAGLEPGDIKDPADLRLLPTLTKDTLRRHYDEFLAAGIPKRDLLTIDTSGTTGTPLQVMLTREARRCNYAFFARSKLWAGVGLHERSATFGGRVIVPPEQTSPPFWRANVFSNNTQFSSFHISPETAQAYFEKIKTLRPALIDSYPSSIYVLARFMKEKGLTGVRPTAIITSSETLLNHPREVIEEVFGCQVFDQYGLAEQVAFVCQCERGSYHVNPEFGIVELLDERGQPVPPGEPGEIVATGFTNPALPLIRYRTGDLARWRTSPCPCGRSFPALEAIEGRLDDLLLTRDGRRIGRLDPVFKGLGHTIAAAQIVQSDYERVILRILRGPGYLEEHGLKVAAEIRKRMGDDIQVTIEYPERIERTRGGKFRAIVCNVPGVEGPGSGGRA